MNVSCVLNVLCVFKVGLCHVFLKSMNVPCVFNVLYEFNVMWVFKVDEYAVCLSVECAVCVNVTCVFKV